MICGTGHCGQNCSCGHSGKAHWFPRILSRSRALGITTAVRPPPDPLHMRSSENLLPKAFEAPPQCDNRLRLDAVHSSGDYILCSSYATATYRLAHRHWHRDDWALYTPGNDSEIPAPPSPPQGAASSGVSANSPGATRGVHGTPPVSLAW